MPANKAMRLPISLESYNDIFKQMPFFLWYKLAPLKTASYLIVGTSLFSFKQEDFMKVMSEMKNWKKLPASFYERSDVVAITKELLGKILVTTFDDVVTAGRIVEAEAYNGPHDKASHSYGNRRTKRTEVMYAQGGVAYVYLCYGIHQMFNVVTNVQDVPNAILIRALDPIVGIPTMLERSNKSVHGFDLTRGPGNVGKALGLHTQHTGMSLQSDELYIADDSVNYSDDEIGITPRIGVEYSAEDALLPYRFIVKGNKYVSGKKM